MNDTYYEIYNRISQIGKRYSAESRKLAPAEVTKIIRRQLVSHLFNIRTIKDNIVSPDMIVVSGIYDCYDDSQHLPCMQLSLNFHPGQDVYFSNLINWEQLAFDVAETAGHEMVHRKQHHEKRPGREYKSKEIDPIKKENQEYLGHEIEIEAYGFSIAFESWHKDIPYEVCPMFVTYLETFSNDNKVIIKLQKYISKYLKELELSLCKIKKNN